MNEQLERINGVSITAKASEVQRIARALFHQSPDWVTFFREMLGVNGVVKSIFSDPKSLAGFETTDEYLEIQQMVAQLRARAPELRPDEPTRVITVRLPQSLHRSLTKEAHSLHTSVNKLCISKLLQVVDEELIPNSREPGEQPASPRRR